MFFLLWGFNEDNSIKLKELQVVSGALRKKDKGLGIFFNFSKEFFWIRKGGWVIPPFSQGVFFF
jgi:hypothetical protein